MSDRWYVVYTKPRSEELAFDNLQNQGFDAYLPTIEQIQRRRKKAVKMITPLFPRYMFVRLNLGKQSILPIRSTRGVVKLVGFGDCPVALPDGFIPQLLSTEIATEEEYCSNASSFFKEGDEVEIAEGPFSGLITTIHSIPDNERVAVLLDILGGKRLLEFEVTAILPVAN